MKLDFAASVSAAGVLVPDDPTAWRAGVARLRGKRVVISLQAVRITRSTQQNRRYWSCIVPLVAEVLSVGRPLPLSKDDAHYVCKWTFLGHEDTALGPIPRHSKTLSTAEFVSYCDAIEAWLAQEHGVALPALGEDMEVGL